MIVGVRPEKGDLYVGVLDKLKKLLSSTTNSNRSLTLGYVLDISIKIIITTNERIVKREG